jgi:hypothetical protein
MKIKFLTIGLIALFLVVLTCVYQLVNLAMENDGLRQVVNSQNESIDILLDYSAVTTRCDLTPEKLTMFLNARHPITHFQPSTNSVGGLAFTLSFRDGHPAALAIVGQRKVNLCEK